MLCKELQYGDRCCDLHGFPMQITVVGDDYAYVTFEGNEGDPWEFDDKDDQPQPIPLTPEILEKNGWKDYGNFMDIVTDEDTHFSWGKDKYGAVIYQDECYICECKYVHTLQHVFRICGLDDLADNFKV